MKLSMLATGALVVGADTLVVAFALRRYARLLGSLRTQVLVITFVSLAIAAVAAVALARFMVLDSGTLNGVLAVLGMALPFVVILVVVATGSLRADVDKIEVAVRHLQQGESMEASVLGRGLGRFDELGSVAAAVDDLGQQLELVESKRMAVERQRAAVDAERRVLISSISHDLRTPISAIRAAVEALVDGVAPDPARYLRSITRDLETLSLLVDDLFLLSQLDSGLLNMGFDPVDLAELVDETAEAMAPLAQKRGVSIKLASSHAVPVVGNAAALGRVLRNLLDNAIRHSPDGSTVRVSVMWSVDPGDRAVVRVVDEGPGFPDDFVAHAFERFARADSSRSRASGGTGLGLAIAKGLVESHGGTIEIEAPPGGRLAVCLPLGRSPLPVDARRTVR